MREDYDKANHPKEGTANLMPTANLARVRAPNSRFWAGRLLLFLALPRLDKGTFPIHDILNAGDWRISASTIGMRRGPWLTEMVRLDLMSERERENSCNVKKCLSRFKMRSY